MRQEKYEAWYLKWRSQRTDDERKLLPPAPGGHRGRNKKKGVVIDQRHAEVHKKGAKVRSKWIMAPLVEQGESGNYWFGPPGVEPPLVRRLSHYFDNDDTEDEIEILKACAQYLKLMEKLVGDFIATRA
jgi:hypothetical protein